MHRPGEGYLDLAKGVQFSKSLFYNRNILVILFQEREIL